MLKQSLLTMAARGLMLFSLHKTLQTRYGGHGVILMFHRLARREEDIIYRGGTVTEAFFERILQRIAGDADLEAIALKNLPERLAANTTKRFVCLTFDDGYKDNFEIGLPLLEKYKIPATIFVSSNAIGGVKGYEWDGLEALLAANESLSIGGIACETKTPKQKQRAFHVYGHHILHDYDIWMPLVEAACKAQGINLEACARKNFMNAEELKTIARSAYVDIGGHTVSHPMLAKLPPERALEEILQNRKDLEGWLGKAPECFAYPFGGPQACGEREYALAKKAGYKLAVTTRAGALFEQHQAYLHALPRFGVSGLYESEAMLEMVLSGSLRALHSQFGPPFIV